MYVYVEHCWYEWRRFVNNATTQYGQMYVLPIIKHNAGSLCLRGKLVFVVESIRNDKQLFNWEIFTTKSRKVLSLVSLLLRINGSP